MDRSSPAVMAEDSAASEVRHGFRIGSNRLLIPQSTHSELAPLPKLCAIPDTPDWFAGFINHRGDTVPAYDLYHLFQEEQVEKRWALILGTQTETIALLLNDYPKGIVGLEPSSAPGGPSSEALTGYCPAYLSNSDEVWAEFDYKRFFQNLKEQI